MPRQPRIEYEDAIYHVMARGNRREAIFLDDDDRELFLRTLGEACERTGFVVYAWVLMGNHYHAVIRTPNANLVAGAGCRTPTPAVSMCATATGEDSSAIATKPSWWMKGRKDQDLIIDIRGRTMSWLQGTYTSRFNARHKLRGHVFGGRYKAILVERDDGEYFPRLIEYVHLNPVRARMIKRRQPLDGYPWSSLRYYRKPPGKRRAWEIAEEGLTSAGCRDNARGRRSYLERLEEKIAWEQAEKAGLVEIEGQSLQSTLRRGWYFGSQAFRERMLVLGEKQLSARSGSDLYRGRDIKDHSMDRAERIVQCGLRFFSLNEEKLPALPKSDWRKALIAVVVKEQTTATLQWLSERLHMGARAGVSRYASQLLDRANKERNLRAQLRQLREKIKNIKN